VVNGQLFGWKTVVDGCSIHAELIKKKTAFLDWDFEVNHRIFSINQNPFKKYRKNSLFINDKTYYNLLT
jgi:hypothetical protein